VKLIGCSATPFGVPNEQLVVALHDDSSAFAHELPPDHLVEFKRLEMNTPVRRLKPNRSMKRVPRFVQWCCVKELAVDLLGRCPADRSDSDL